MDRRFVETWRRLEERRHAGERFDRLLATQNSEDLIAALAGASGRDAVAANAIATEILNRFRRVRKSGPVLGALGAALALFSVEFLGHEIYHEMWLGLRPNPVLLALAALAIAILSFTRLAGTWFGLLGRASGLFHRRGSKGAK